MCYGFSLSGWREKRRVVVEINSDGSAITVTRQRQPIENYNQKQIFIQRWNVHQNYYNVRYNDITFSSYTVPCTANGVWQFFCIDTLPLARRFFD